MRRRPRPLPGARRRPSCAPPLAEAMLLATAQTADVRPMRPEDEERDHGAHDEEWRTRSEGDQQDGGQHDGGDHATERDVSGGEDHGDEQGERDGHWNWSEREEDTRGGGDPFPPAAELEENWPHVAGDRGDAAGDCPDDGIVRAGDAQREVEYGERPLQRVGEEHQQADLPSENAEDVGRAEIARALLPEIDAAQLARN